MNSNIKKKNGLHTQNDASGNEILSESARLGGFKLRKHTTEQTPGIPHIILNDMPLMCKDT